MRSKLLRRLAAVLIFALLLTAQALPALAYADDAGEPDAVTIRITPPSGAASEKTAVEIRVTDNTGEGFQSVYVKTSEGQEWRDLTPYLEKQENRCYGAVEITQNCTVYVRVTANNGKTYEKSRYVECYGTAADAPYTAELVKGDALIPAAGGSADATPQSSTALTPDGQGTVMDNVSDADGKEFFTITTPAENVFYLVIDRERDGENVYFLNAVTEADLLALAETDAATGAAANTGITAGIPGIINNTPSSAGAVCTCKDKCAPGEVDVSCPVCVLNYKGCAGVEREHTAEPEPQTVTRGGSVSTIAVVVIVLLVVGGAGYYFKIYKPKREMDDAEDVDEVTGRTEDKPVNEDDLPPFQPYQSAPPPAAPVPYVPYEPDEPTEPDYPTYEDYQRGDEPPEPDYEDE